MSYFNLLTCFHHDHMQRHLCRHMQQLVLPRHFLAIYLFILIIERNVTTARLHK